MNGLRSLEAAAKDVRAVLTKEEAMQLIHQELRETASRRENNSGNSNSSSSNSNTTAMEVGASTAVTVIGGNESGQKSEHYKPKKMSSRTRYRYFSKLFPLKQPETNNF